MRRGRTLTPLRIYYMTCTFDDCERPHSAHGLCSQHDRQRKEGKALTKLRPWRETGLWQVNGGGYRTKTMIVNGRSTRVYEHRVVMEQVLGRPLLPDENVHHINGDRLDNRRENLELWTTRQPQGQRVADKVAWAKALLAEYEPSALQESAS